MGRERSTRVKSCRECRRLKIKCDLTFPCSQCIKRGCETICPNGELTNGSRRTKVLASTEELHDRIASLEEALAQLAPRHALLATPSQGPPSEMGATGNELEDGSSHHGCLVVGEAPEYTVYYGSASSLYLSEKRMLNRQPQDRFFSPLLASWVDPGGPPTLSEIMEAYLPQESVAQELANHYFDTVGRITRIVQPLTWHARFFDHVYRSSSPLPQRVAVLLLVLALAAKVDYTRPAGDSTDVSLIAAARMCLRIDPTPSVTMIQAIYLFVSCMLNGDHEVTRGVDFWPLLRSSAAIAEAIGLHRDPSHWNLDPETATERRFVFWQTFHFDVVQSMALGRGQAIPSNRVDCAIPEVQGDTPYFPYTFRLVRITSAINELLVRVKPATYEEVRALEAQLWTFERSLPPNMSPSAPNLPHDLVDPRLNEEALHRNQLLLYYNEARLALHRPWFARSLSDNPKEPCNSRYWHSYVGCLEACRSIVGLVSNMVAICGPQVQRRWHFFFHLFSACACLAAAAIRAPRGTMAQSALVELDKGIGLFRIGRPDMLNVIQELRDEACRQVYEQNGNAPPAPSRVLDLLGVSTVLERTNVSRTASLPAVVDPPAGGLLVPAADLLDFDASTDFDLQAFLGELGLWDPSR